MDLHRHGAHHGHGHHPDPSPGAPGAVRNDPHQHAFVLVGDRALFAVHMTQFHSEVHKYQLVFRLDLPEDAKAAVTQARRARPSSDLCVLCNAEDDLLTIPELACGARPTFRANVFLGFKPPSATEAWDMRFFPWARERVKPLMEGVTATVVRVVLFRPFAHHLPQPDCATYLLFGEGEEAHMTNLQTAREGGPAAAPLFGPDYDHVMSLRRAPGWLDGTMLRAGVVVAAPAVRLRDHRGAPVIPCDPPFEDGGEVGVLYRGLGPPRPVVAGPTFFYATGICNSPGVNPCPPERSIHASAPPP